MRSRTASPAAIDADVCLIVEGCYPVVSGGVSSWLDWLMRSLPETTFSVVAISSGSAPRTARYKRPENLISFVNLNIADPEVLAVRPRATATLDAEALASCTARLLVGGKAQQLADVLRVLKTAAGNVTLPDLLNSRAGWTIVRRMYEELVPTSSFLQFFWTWRCLVGGLYALALAPLPKARCYHAISTGYAGLLSARATLETGRPSLLTEHGIYTNERRIELMMAPWIFDTVDKGFALSDERLDIREIWIEAFNAYARCAYEACDHIITLFGENQIMQRDLGAMPDKQIVIPNGIELAPYAGISRPAENARPTIALIGRVVPIKDVKTYIAAVDHARRKVPNLRALVLGGTDEDPSYYTECQEMVADFGLSDTIEFTGNVRVMDYLSQIDVVVLTSLSEAQPLVILEAGAASMPCVTTNVGCCRELLEGRATEVPNLGRGGYVTDIAAPEQLGDAVSSLLLNARERERMGRNLCERITRHYTSASASQAYRELYNRVVGRSSKRAA